MIFIGIDNGLQGAAVAIDETMSIIDWIDTPTIKIHEVDKKKKKKKTKTIYNEIAMLEWLQSIVNLPAFCLGEVKIFIEYAQAIPGNRISTSAMFRLGEGHGLWRGIITGFGFRYYIVRPKAWQSVAYNRIKTINPKLQSAAACEELFPALNIYGPRGRLMDGRSDAALIAYFGLQQEIGKRP